MKNFKSILWSILFAVQLFACIGVNNAMDKPIDSLIINSKYHQYKIKIPFGFKKLDQFYSLTDALHPNQYLLRNNDKSIQIGIADLDLKPYHINQDLSTYTTREIVSNNKMMDGNEEWFPITQNNLDLNLDVVQYKKHGIDTVLINYSSDTIVKNDLKYFTILVRYVKFNRVAVQTYYSFTSDKLEEVFKMIQEGASNLIQFYETKNNDFTWNPYENIIFLTEKTWERIKNVN